MEYGGAAESGKRSRHGRLSDQASILALGLEHWLLASGDTPNTRRSRSPGRVTGVPILVEG